MFCMSGASLILFMHISAMDTLAIMFHHNIIIGKNIEGRELCK